MEETTTLEESTESPGPETTLSSSQDPQATAVSDTTTLAEGNTRGNISPGTTVSIAPTGVTRGTSPGAETTLSSSQDPQATVVSGTTTLAEGNTITGTTISVALTGVTQGTGSGPETTLSSSQDPQATGVSETTTLVEGNTITGTTVSIAPTGVIRGTGSGPETTPSSSQDPQATGVSGTTTLAEGNIRGNINSGTTVGVAPPGTARDTSSTTEPITNNNETPVEFFDNPTLPVIVFTAIGVVTVGASVVAVVLYISSLAANR